MFHLLICFFLFRASGSVHPSGESFMHSSLPVGHPESKRQLLSLDIVLHQFFSLDIKMSKFSFLFPYIFSKSINLFAILNDSLLQFTFRNSSVYFLEFFVMEFPLSESRSHISFQVFSSVCSEIQVISHYFLEGDPFSPSIEVFRKREFLFIIMLYSFLWFIQ